MPTFQVSTTMIYLVEAETPREAALLIRDGEIRSPEVVHASVDMVYDETGSDILWPSRKAT